MSLAACPPNALFGKGSENAGENAVRRTLKQGCQSTSALASSDNSLRHGAINQWPRRMPPYIMGVSSLLKPLRVRASLSMARRQDIDRVLREWPYEPGEISARVVRAADGREVLQMRVEMGLLQLEIEGRPDGQRPGGADSYFDYLVKIGAKSGEHFELSSEQCTEADREFMQFYHRRVCWLALREFRRAAADADHTLHMMDFVREHSPDEEWTLSHEQYRPFVLFHRTQASTLATLEEKGAQEALQELHRGLQLFRDLFTQYEAEEQFNEDELVHRLLELRDTLRQQYDLKPSLTEQLADAVAAEEYELAAKLRDELSRRTGKSA